MRSRRKCVVRTRSATSSASTARIFSASTEFRLELVGHGLHLGVHGLERSRGDIRGVMRELEPFHLTPVVPIRFSTRSMSLTMVLGSA